MYAFVHFFASFTSLLVRSRGSWSRNSNIYRVRACGSYSPPRVHIPQTADHGRIQAVFGESNEKGGGPEVLGAREGRLERHVQAAVAAISRRNDEGPIVHTWALTTGRITLLPPMLYLL